MAKILIVEDDQLLLESIVDWLKRERHIMETVCTAQDGLDRMLHYQFDLIILDWQLPGGSGLELLREFRARGGHTAVLMLTGKQSVQDKKSGLDSGADDYLTKPFDLIELSARVRALLRRTNMEFKAVLEGRGVKLDPVKATVSMNGVSIHVPQKEFCILELLMKHPGEFFNAEAICARIWKDESDISPETIRTYINRLRSKINDPENERIKTVWRRGYKFDA